LRKRKSQNPDKGLEATYSRLDHASRQRQLIDATMHVIAQYGISGMTLQRVAEAADITAGMVNFHFKSKEALLTATLELLIQEYASELSSAVAASSTPAEALATVVERHFAPPIMTAERTALWYAFWGETQARHGYQQICAEADRFLWRLVHEQMMQLHPSGIAPSLARGMTSAMIGMISVFVQELMLQPDESDRASAIHACLAYLKHIFPNQVFPINTGRNPSEAEEITSAPAITERSAEWIVATLRDIDLNLARGLPLGEICTKQRLDAKMIGALRRKFHDMSIEQVRYVLALEARNLKLTENLVDRALDARLV
jgi:AcrR family transcriptional regulator